MADMRIVFETKPFPKERPRATKQGRVFTPTKTIKYERELKELFRKQFPEHEPFTEPVNIEVDVAVDKICVEITKVDHKPKGMRGDLDNYVKAIMDALNGEAFEDDRQVVEITARKVGP